MSSTTLENPRWRFEPIAPPQLEGWRGWLPPARSEARAVDAERLAEIQRLVANLPAEILTETASALHQWWPLRPRHAQGFELVVVHPDGTREKHQVHHRVLRIGRDPACSLQLRSEVISSEHCEIRVDDTKLWLVDLGSSNGTRLDEAKVTPWEPKLLDPGSRIEVGPFRLVIGQPRSRAADPSFSVRVLGVELHHSGFPAARLGTPDSPWVEIATAPTTGGFRGWIRLPATWLRSARNQVPNAPAVAPTAAFDTPLDYAITAYLLSKVAGTFEARSGIAVTVATPEPQAALLRHPPEGSHFAVARLEVAVGDAGWLADVVWEAPEPPRRRATITDGVIGELILPVAVVVGAIALPPSELAGIDRGDILVPDRWYPEHWIEDSEATLGHVELRVQSWEATGTLRFEKGFFHLEPTSAWTVRPQGDSMPPTSDDRRDDTAEHDLAAADPTRLVDELEVTVAFELARLPVPLRELADWREGGLVRLDHRPEDPIRLVLHHGGRSRLLGYGRVVVVDERLGIQIDRWLGAEESR